jgi:hypothetical protein
VGKSLLYDLRADGIEDALQQLSVVTRLYTLILYVFTELLPSSRQFLLGQLFKFSASVLQC